MPESQPNPIQIPSPPSHPITPLTPLVETPTVSPHGSPVSPVKSLPGLVSISISDSNTSDDDVSAYKQQINMSQPTKTTLLSNETTACYSSENGKPPIITAGELTLDLLADFENGCYAYFSMKDVKDNKLQVGKIAWGLQDARI